MKETITKKGVLRSLLWVYGETMVTQMVSFVVTVVLARLLAPGDYGTIALVTVFVNIANVFVSSSFSMGLVQKNNVEQIDFNTIFWFNLFSSCVLYALIFCIAPLVAEFYDNDILSPILRVLAIRIPLSAYNSVQVAYVTRRMMFKKSFVATSIGNIFSGVIGIVCALLGAGVWALVMQSISSVLVSTVSMAFVVKWRPQMEFSFEKLKELVSYGWKLLATGLMFTGYSEIRSLVIGKKYSSDDLGFYNKGCQFPQLVAANVDTTIIRVMFPTLSNSQDSIEQVSAMTRRAAKTSAYIMTPLLFGMAIVADKIVSILLTDKWLPCVPYMSIMCIVWWLQPTQSCSIQALKAIGRTDKYLKIELMSKGIGILLLIGAVIWMDTPVSIAITMLISQIVALFIYGVNVSKYIGYSVRNQIKDLVGPAVLGCFMSVVVLGIGTIITNQLLSLVLQIATGAITYIGLSKILKLEQFEYLYKTIIKKGE